MPNLVAKQNELPTVESFIEPDAVAASVTSLPNDTRGLAFAHSHTEALATVIPVEAAREPRLGRIRRALGYISTAYYRAGVKFESIISGAQEKVAKVSPKLAGLVLPVMTVASTYAAAKGMGIMGGDFVHHTANMMQSIPTSHTGKLSAHTATLMNFHANVKSTAPVDPQVLRTAPTVSKSYADLRGGFHENWNQMLHDARSAQNDGDLRVIHVGDKFFYEVHNGHGGWTSQNSAVLRVMADDSGGRRVFAGAGNSIQNIQAGHHQVPLHGETPSHQPITENPGGTTAPEPSQSGNKIVYREETPWWVWPAVAGAAIGGIAVGAVATDHHYHHVRETHETRSRSAKRKRGRLRRREPKKWMIASAAWFGRQHQKIRRQRQRFHRRTPPGDTSTSATTEDGAAGS